MVPGPGLFQNQMDFVVALYLALLILNVLVLIFLLGATKSLIQVVRIPNRFLGVGILTLSFVGVYSLRNSATDCFMAAGFGLFGFVLKRLQLPAVPIILGMVLGGMDSMAPALNRTRAGGTPYGAEEYLENRRVRWTFLDGDCKEGRWFSDEPGLICFVYEDRPEPQCWSFLDSPGGLIARFENDPQATELYEVRQSDDPLECPGPRIGV